MENIRNIPKNDLLNQINDLIQAISDKIKRRSKKNDHSLNIFLEQDFIPIYNIAFNGNFNKCEGANHPAIDLLDSDQKIGVQVSSEITKQKIQKTLEKFYKNEDKLNISKLKFFFLSQNTSSLTKIKLSELEEYLNDANRIEQINKKRTNKLEEIQIKPEFFNPNEDIVCFDFINKKHHELDIEKLYFIEKKLCDIWPHSQITSDDLVNYLTNLERNSINISLDKLPNPEAIELIIKTFIPLRIIPYHILTGLHYSREKIGITVKQSTLITENKILLNDIKTEKRTKGSKLINFLLRNEIHRITLYNSMESIDIYDYFYSDTSYQMCNYEELSIDPEIIYRSPIQPGDDQSLEDSFKKAYLFAEYGKYNEAVDQYTAIWDFCKGKKHIANFITLYCLKRLKYSLYQRFDENSPINKISDDLAKALNKDFSNIVPESLTREEKDVIDYLYQFKHVNIQHKTLNLIKDTEKAIRIDNKRGYFLNDLIGEWYMVAFHTVSFTIHNFLLFDSKFAEISQIVYRAFKSILDLSLCRNAKTSEKEVWGPFIKITISKMNETDLKECLSTYHKKSPLLSGQNNLDSINSIIDKIISNLHQNLEIIGAYLKSLPNVRFSFHDNINSTFRNICMYLTYLDFQTERLNENFEKLLDIFEKEGIIWPSSSRLLEDLINKKQASFSEVNCKRILSILSSNPHLLTDLNLYHSNFIDLTKFEYTSADIDTLFDLWVNRRDEINNDALKLAYKNSLDKSFNFDFLRLGVIFDLIEFDSYKDITLGFITDKIKNNYDHFTNDWVILSFVEIAYHINLDLSSPEYNKFVPKKHKEQEYYKFLLNLETFDYSNFDPQWLLKYPYSVFLNRFKQIPQIKDKLKEYLKTNENGELSNIYFNYFLKDVPMS